MKVALSRALLLGATLLGNFHIHGILAVNSEEISAASNGAAADEEDAAFWERFLGNTYKRKPAFMSIMPTPKPSPPPIT
jgi:hypothetical protein